MANQPSIIPSAWAANNSTTETIPATTSESGKASWDQGFPVETSLPLSEGGIPPKYGDFNGVLNVLSQFCLFAQAGGQYAWSNTLDYSVGSIVLGTDGSIYRAAQVSGPSTTAVNPVGDTSGKWERVVSQSDINALEQDISDAMDAAEDAASNASAAQSAVTTLDANVVKLSGNQTVGGVKTFTSNIGTTAYPAMYNPDEGDDNVLQIIAGHTTSGAAGAKLSLAGANVNGENQGGDFTLQAGKSGAYCQFIGKPDGTLTWGGSNINTAAKPGVQLVEYTDSTSRTLNAHGGAQYTISPPSISGYTAKEVVAGRGNGSTGILVGCWNDPTKAWVHNCNTASKTFTVTYLILYTRN